MPLITDPAGLSDLLAGAHTIAIIGWSPNPSRPSHSIAEYLRAAGYRVFPVNPEVGRANGDPAFSTLRDIPEAIDIVTVFRRPEFVAQVVEDVLVAGAKALWLQDGVIHSDAAKRAMAAGLRVVMDRCVRRDHRRLIGGGAKPQSVTPSGA